MTNPIQEYPADDIIQPQGKSASRSKLIGKKELEDEVQGEPDLSSKIAQGDLKAEEWKELLCYGQFYSYEHCCEHQHSNRRFYDTVKVVDSYHSPLKFPHQT
jgi:hypothetical protein